MANLIFSSVVRGKTRFTAMARASQGQAQAMTILKAGPTTTSCSAARERTICWAERAMTC
ncbi:MAG: hypothetical protein B7X88_05795 [Polaromonas sp. 17-63-33]|nr:MAG: hypothetical protein B7Y60_12940 [Polaromonas sp. 35-63-35]OZA52198.1 MAG: hypothetical protein B7X88_05795 [Polaromonas sp. 17-63-33]